MDVPSLPLKKIDTSKTFTIKITIKDLRTSISERSMGGGVRMSETRIALRRSSDEDSRFQATRLKTSYRSFDTYRVIRTFFSSVDFNLSLELIDYYWIVYIYLLQAETKVFMIDWMLD